ncbi:histidine phosphotransferase family protein [Paracoccus sp. CPCC 101403]|uniref:Histidine phosphotransferase family protein n=2 Tax=Paracoccus broussonetiae TaxID=3075834 RepID=A0ABU3EBF2_9RHOB|nr:histidine phosphotransferase family protein [Paracoccus sp. CPCC 101403]MDT1061548.1 histidine phosphotransferase family protein [Paracoccus sp. CPCC 101403]
MNDVTISRSTASPFPALPERLASLVSSRLCHDLISPLGAIGNGVELLQMSGDYPGLTKSPELGLIAESVEAARARIRWFRLAFGHASAEQRLALNELAGLMADIERQGRIRVRLEAQGDLPRSEARLILLGVMCLETALPWGGSILICRGAVGWRLLAEAARTKSDPALWAWLDADPALERVEPQPSEIHFPLLAAFAAQEGRSLGWELDEKGGEIWFHGAQSGLRQGG